jgi:hypothetical protein
MRSLVRLPFRIIRNVTITPSLSNVRIDQNSRDGAPPASGCVGRSADTKLTDERAAAARPLLGKSDTERVIWRDAEPPAVRPLGAGDRAKRPSRACVTPSPGTVSAHASKPRYDSDHSLRHSSHPHAQYGELRRSPKLAVMALLCRAASTRHEKGSETGDVC